MFSSRVFSRPDVYSSSNRAFPVMNYVLLLCTDNVVDNFYNKIDDTSVVALVCIPMISVVSRWNSKIVKANRNVTKKWTDLMKIVSTCSVDILKFTLLTIKHILTEFQMYVKERRVTNITLSLNSETCNVNSWFLIKSKPPKLI